MSDAIRPLIVGAGPAGIRAAQVLVNSGIRPVVIDEAPSGGGQIYRQRLVPDERSAKDLYGSEAAKATNLTARQTWIHVILPQAVPPMIPAMANYLLAMFKETPLLSAITVLELMNQARSVANSSYRYVEPMTMVGVMFLIVSVISVVGLRWLERRFWGIGR